MRGEQTNQWLQRYDLFRTNMLLAAHRRNVRNRRVVRMDRLFATHLTLKERHAAERQEAKFLAREVKCHRVANDAGDRFAQRYLTPVLNELVHLKVWSERQPSSMAIAARKQRVEAEYYRRFTAMQDVQWRAFRRCMRPRLPKDLRGLEAALRDWKHAA